MSNGFTLIIIAEVIALLFLCWGWLHEGKFIKLEYKLGIRKLKHNEDIITLKSQRWDKKC